MKPIGLAKAEEASIEFEMVKASRFGTSLVQIAPLMTDIIAIFNLNRKRNCENNIRLQKLILMHPCALLYLLHFKTCGQFYIFCQPLTYQSPLTKPEK